MSQLNKKIKFIDRKGKFWIIFYMILVLQLSIFIGIYVATEPFWHIINYYLYSITDLNWNFTLLFTIIWIILQSYSLYLLIFHIKKIIKDKKIRPRVLNVILPVVIFISVCFIFYLFLDIASSEADLFFKLLEGTSFFIFLFIVIILIISVYPIISAFSYSIYKLQKLEKSKVFLKKIRLFLYLNFVFLMFIGAFLLPFIFIAPNVIDGPLPLKPLIIAHRGASQYAPENTLAAGEATVLFGAAGWEIDVQKSSDGEFFLLHDSNFKRTTNIESVFPDRAGDDASTFTINEIRMLDAGSWFVDEDPYGTIARGIVSKDVAESYRGIKIPLLEEVLNLTQYYGLILDLEGKGISVTDNDFLKLLDDYNLGKNLWLYTSSNQASDYTRAHGPISVENFLSSDYELINTGLGIEKDLLLAYDAADIPVVVYTIDDKSIFSSYWCMGADYIKTNRPWEFNDMKKPLWFKERVEYYVFWVFLEFFGVLFAIIASNILLQSKYWKKEKKNTIKYSEKNPMI